MNTFREYLSSVMDCIKITTGAWKQYLLKAEFEERNKLHTGTCCIRRTL